VLHAMEPTCATLDALVSIGMGRTVLSFDYS
jgi:hypothetical protein